MPLANYYDIPEVHASSYVPRVQPLTIRCLQVSLRGPFLPPLLRNKTLVQPFFGVDPVHMAQPLHQALGELLIAYMQEQRCAVLDEMRNGEADLFPQEGLLLDAVIPGEVPSVSRLLPFPHFQ